MDKTDVSPPNLTQEIDPLSEKFNQFITVHNYQNLLQRSHPICMRQERAATEISDSLHFSRAWTQSEHFSNMRKTLRLKLDHSAGVRAFTTRYVRKDSISIYSNIFLFYSVLL